MGTPREQNVDFGSEEQDASFGVRAGLARQGPGVSDLPALVTVMAMGRGQHGELGVGALASSSVPRPVKFDAVRAALPARRALPLHSRACGDRGRWQALGLARISLISCGPCHTVRTAPFLSPTPSYLLSDQAVHRAAGGAVGAGAAVHLGGWHARRAGAWRRGVHRHTHSGAALYDAAGAGAAGACGGGGGSQLRAHCSGVAGWSGAHLWRGHRAGTRWPACHLHAAPALLGPLPWPAGGARGGGRRLRVGAVHQRGCVLVGQVGARPAWCVRVSPRCRATVCEDAHHLMRWRAQAWAPRPCARRQRWAHVRPCVSSSCSPR